MVDYETLLVTQHEGVATITLNRPEHLNAWDWTMHRELGHAYATLDGDDVVRAIVLTGAGRAFCAGAMLAPGGEMFDGSTVPSAHSGRDPGLWLSARQLVTPVIAAINGAAVGAGITMALQCDIRIVAAEAKIGFVFNRRGVIADDDLLWLLPRMIGYGRAMELLLTGRIITGADAVQLGLASQATSTADVLQAAQKVATDIAENTAPTSAAITKHLGRQLLEVSDRTQARELQTELFRWAGRSRDAREGVEAFLAKRRPAWHLSKNDDLPYELLGSVGVRQIADRQRNVTEEARGPL